MTLPEDRPNTSERYSSALRSSHLELTAKPGDVDLLIPSGWTRDGLGCQLYRLRVEFDSINRLELARADNLTAKLMTLNHLTTLRPALSALAEFAQGLAARSGIEQGSAVHWCSSAALANWIDPNCPHCQGRGVSGGFGTPRTICNHCGGSGKRQVRLGKTEPMHQFGRRLLTHMDTKTELVAKRMRDFLGQRAAAKRLKMQAATAALSQRLAELRSTAAQED